MDSRHLVLNEKKKEAMMGNQLQRNAKTKKNKTQN